MGPAKCFPQMLMVCHHLQRSIREWRAISQTFPGVRYEADLVLLPPSAEDIAFAESRIRAETVAAEDVLQDMGAISMISSDAQAMGRIGEVVSRSWRTASKMKEMRGRLPEEKGENDNERVKVSPKCRELRQVLNALTMRHCIQRYVAKYTVNPSVRLAPVRDVVF